uniref:Uncharacterized protein n=1 Tax=Coccolithus braarudii TaxID=221442 RepID=A0A7S0Q803_9EUKA
MLEGGLQESLLMAELCAAAARTHQLPSAEGGATTAPPSSAKGESQGDEPAERVELLLEQLRLAKAGTEDRRAGIESLLALLTVADGASAKERRPVMNAFVDGEGPRLLHEIESSMTGDWVTDAKNGTLRNVSALSQLPGPVGIAVSRYRGMAQRRVEGAALHLHGGQCTH